MKQKMSVVLIDDEVEACNNLRQMLAEIAPDSIEIAGQAQNTKDAGAIIDRLKPDAVFLDISMPVEDGLQFLDRLFPFDFEVIFVTAYDIHAIRAFRLNAVDYLLKPLHTEDLADAVRKLGQKLEHKRLTSTDTADFRFLSRQIRLREPARRLTLRDGNSVAFVDFGDILYLEAKGSYSRIIYRSGKQHQSMVMSFSLSEYEEILPDDLFFRSHRSYLVSRAHVSCVKTGDFCTVVLSNGAELPVSRRRAANFIGFLKLGDATGIMR